MNMEINADMHPLFEDYLDCLRALHEAIKTAIADLPPEALDWTAAPEMNSINVLVTHLTGAGRYLIGDLVAGHPSGRDRAAEFEARRLSVEELLHELDTSLDYIHTELDALEISALNVERYSPVHDRVYTAGWSLLHALEHTAIHLGHIQLTRQLWEAGN